MFTRILNNRLVAALVALAVATFSFAQKADAAAVFYGANQATTATTVYAPGGNRGLDQMGFLGSSTVFTAANFLNFADGSLRTYSVANGYQTFGWNDAIARDMTSNANIYIVNPDRADNSTPYPLELSGQAKLSDVFGPFSHAPGDPTILPYKNLGYILDGEAVAGKDDQRFTLLFPKGKVLNADSDTNTIELAWLERGGNSSIKVRGILGFDISNNPILTPDVVTLLAANVKYAGWQVDTLEINSRQGVFGLGASLDSSWKNLIGFQFTGFTGSNGADTVAVGTAFLTPDNTTPVPLPAAFPAGLTLLGIIAIARRFH